MAVQGPYFGNILGEVNTLNLIMLCPLYSVNLVQMEAAGYSKSKTISKSKQSAVICDEKLAASSLFRDSIKKRNARKLCERQSLNSAAWFRTCREF